MEHFCEKKRTFCEKTMVFWPYFGIFDPFLDPNFVIFYKNRIKNGFYYRPTVILCALDSFGLHWPNASY